MTPGTNVRIQSPNSTVLRQGAPQLAGKQLILQKPLPQGQIVTLVKTSQGLSVASVNKSSLVQSKAGVQTTNTVIQQAATGHKNPTIVKLLPNSVTGMQSSFHHITIMLNLIIFFTI